jgi:hypothetical protein
MIVGELAGAGHIPGVADAFPERNATPDSLRNP